MTHQMHIYIGFTELQGMPLFLENQIYQLMETDEWTYPSPIDDRTVEEYEFDEEYDGFLFKRTEYLFMNLGSRSCNAIRRNETRWYPIDQPNRMILRIEAHTWYPVVILEDFTDLESGHYRVMVSFNMLY